MQCSQVTIINQRAWRNGWGRWDSKSLTSCFPYLLFQNCSCSLYHFFLPFFCIKGCRIYLLSVSCLSLVAKVWLRPEINRCDWPLAVWTLKSIEESMYSTSNCDVSCTYLLNKLCYEEGKCYVLRTFFFLLLLHLIFWYHVTCFWFATSFPFSVLKNVWFCQCI